MAKIKLRLEMDPVPDAEVIGISCHARDHRLCWAINLGLGLALTRRRTDIVAPAGGGRFAAFDHADTDGRIRYTLVSNRGTQGHLVREQPQADHFLVLDGDAPLQRNELMEQLRGIDVVLAAFPLDIRTLSAGTELLPP